MLLAQTDGKYMVIKKPTRSGNKFFNYKSFFLLDLVDAEYRFLWVDVVSSGSSSDTQICNHCKLNKKTGTLGLPPPKLMGRKGFLCTTSCWVHMIHIFVYEGDIF